MSDSQPPEEGLRPQELYRALTSHSCDILSILDGQGRLVFNSAAAEVVSGFTLDELAGIDTFELIHPDDRPEVQQVFAGVLARHGAVGTVRYRYRTKAGGWTWMEAVAVNHLDDPLLRGVVASSRDVSERVRAEEALRASEERFRSFLAACQEGFARVGEGGAVLECNDQLARILGCRDAAELGRHSFYDFVFPEDRAAMEAERRGHREGTTGRSLARLRRLDGTERWVQVSSAALRDPEGHFVAWQAFLADVTETRTLEERLARAQRLEGLGTLAGGVAHDFNNLLVGILGGADLARQEVPPGHPAQESLRIVTEAAQRAAGLCRQLLAFAGRAEPRLEPVHLGALLRETSDLLGVSAGRGRTLHCQVEPDLPVVMGDPHQLRQVLLNLVTNAAEASGPGDAITLAAGQVMVDAQALRTFQFGDAGPPGRWVQLRVADRGHGIAPAVLARIFDPFFSTKASGRGLGLAATLGVVRRHGGCIRVESELGTGTTFTILLPLGGSSPAARSSPSTDDPGGQIRLQGRALVVDDEPTVRRVARRILAGLGLEVTEAQDGQEGAEAVEADPSRYALVLLDLTMPRLDGVGALARIRAVAPGLPVLLASGYAQEESRASLRALGVTELVEKPYDVTTLGGACRRALATRPPES